MIKGLYFQFFLFLAIILAGPSSARAAEELSLKEKQVSAAYAQHLYTSICSQTYRGKFPIYSLSEKDRQQLNKHTNQACACEYEAVAKVTTPTTTVDYLMYTFGMVAGDPATRKTRPLNETPLFKPIYAALADKNLRKKCGFVK